MAQIKSCIPDIFRESIQHLDHNELIEYAKQQCRFIDRVDIIQERYKELTGRIIPLYKIQPEESIRFDRILKLTRMLIDDVKWAKENGGMKKVKANRNDPKPPHQIMVDLGLALNSAYKDLLLNCRNNPEINELIKEVNDERVKDLHGAMDVLFSIDNISILTAQLDEILSPPPVN